MTPVEFGKLISGLAHLTDKQRLELQRLLSESSLDFEMIKGIESRLVDSPECPHWHSHVINRHGKKGGVQRYRCKNCLKTFMATTNTPFARLHYKDKWLKYFKGMLSGKALRPLAKMCGINLETAFRWRHRFLQIPAQQKGILLEGIIEADEVFFPQSEKGNKHLKRKARKRGKLVGKRGRKSEDWVTVLTARDRGANVFESLLSEVSAKELSKQLSTKVGKDSVFCSDGFKSYIRFTREHDLIHKRLNLSDGIRVIDKVFHIQNVNAYHSRLKEWMIRFHGVATKYLENYLGWFRMIDATENLNEIKLFRVQQHLIGT